MRMVNVTAVALVLGLLTLAGCGGGGGGGGAAGSTTGPPNDTVAPTVSITAPASGAVLSGITAVNASPSDNVAVTRVEFYLNGGLVSTQSSPPYSINWDASTFPKGSYALLVKAFDAAGNLGQSGTVQVSVPLSVSMVTTITGSSAVGTVALHGLTAAEAFGVDLRVVSLPAGASIASYAGSGGASAATAFPINPDLVTLGLAGSVGFGSGEVMQIHFINVPAQAVPSDFGVSLLGVTGRGFPIEIF
jgi:hypothetical protein